MKKVIVAMLTVALMLMPMTALAAEEHDVWIETSVDNAEVDVKVVSNGKTAAGVLTLKYDAAVFDCDVADIVVADGVDMYSANVVTDGTLMISYVADKDIDAGTMFTVVLEATNGTITDAALESLTITGEAYNSDGAGKTVGEDESEDTEDTEDTENTENSEDTEDPTDPDDPDTGDNSPIMMFVIVVIVGAGVVYYGLKKKTVNNK